GKPHAHFAVPRGAEGVEQLLQVLFLDLDRAVVGGPASGGGRAVGSPPLTGLGLSCSHSCSFVARDGSAGGPLGDASAGYAEAVRPRGRKSYLCTRKLPGISRAWARSSQSSSTGSRPTLRRRRPAGPGLEDRADAAQAGGVRDHPE